MAIDTIVGKMNLDFAMPSGLIQTLHAKQQDHGTRKVEFTFYDNGAPYTVPSGLTVSYCGTKADGYGFDVAMVRGSSGVWTATLTKQVLACAGRIPVDVKVTDGTNILKSMSFVLNVHPAALTDETFESSDDYQTFQEYLDEAEKHAKAAEAARSAAETARGAAETAKQKAETAQNKAETAKATAETKASEATSSATQAKASAAAAKTSETTATQKANAASSSARSAAASESGAEQEKMKAMQAAEDAAASAKEAKGYKDTAQGVIDRVNTLETTAQRIEGNIDSAQQAAQIAADATASIEANAIRAEQAAQEAVEAAGKIPTEPITTAEIDEITG